jgi:hypothetical protein
MDAHGNGHIVARDTCDFRSVFAAGPIEHNQRRARAQSQDARNMVGAGRR